MKKILAVAAAIALALGVVNILAGAQSAPSPAPEGTVGSVYYLNFKPEQAAQWEAVAKRYTQLTGVPVTVLTATSGTYEDTLRSEMEKTDPPTLFQVNGPTGLRTWRDWCADLRQTALYENLQNAELALHEGEAVLAVPYAIETYGLIVNKTLLAKAGYTVEDISDFASLKAVAEDIQARRDELGVRGAFTSAGMDASSDWRFKTHLANLPIYYEYKASGVENTAVIHGDYLAQFKEIWDLYLNNATCESGVIGARTGEDAASEFALGEAVFYQNGTWAYHDCVSEGLTDDELAMLPIYMGVEDEAQQGLCVGSENYWCINRLAAAEDVEATKAFTEWLITSDEGRSAMTQEMGFSAPFTTFDGYTPQNALQAAAQEVQKQGKTPVTWDFATIPSETWKNNVGAAMLEYAQGTADWDAVERAFVDGWAAESNAAQ